jgi:hypothetical protein
MKRYAVYILTGVHIFVCGILAGWWLNTRDLKRRIAPTFDRSVYKDLCVDFMDEIILSQHGGGGDKTYSVGGGIKATPCTLAMLERSVYRLSRCTYNYRACISVDTNASLQDVFALRAIVESNKCNYIKMLVEYPPFKPDSPFREFRELRLGPQHEIEWHQKEWYIDYIENEANKKQTTVIKH